MSDTSTQKSTKKSTQLTDTYSLILWNDDVNTFDDVIDALMDICGHDEIQAEQCAYLTHLKGKCSVRSGEEFKKLSKLKSLFDNRLINTTIE